MLLLVIYQLLIGAEAVLFYLLQGLKLAELPTPVWRMEVSVLTKGTSAQGQAKQGVNLQPPDKYSKQ